MISDRAGLLLPILLLMLYAAASLLTLTTFPLVWGDEGWYVGSAWSFVRDGDFALPMFEGVAGFDRDNVVYGRVYLLAIAAAFAVGDAATPEAARLVSFISGVVAIVAIVALGRELWTTRIGLLAAVLLALSPNFIDQSHDARPEIMQLAFTLSAFALLLAGQRRGSGPMLVLAGVLAVLAADTHLNGVIVPIGLLAVLLVRRASRRVLVLFIVGCAVASAWWLFVHVASDPALFMAQLRQFGNGQQPLEALLASPAIVIGMGLARYARVDVGSLALLLAGLVATYELWRRHDDLALRSLSVFAAVQLLFYVLLVSNKQPIYAIAMWPVLALLTARLLSVIRPRAAVLGAAAIMIASFISVGHMVLRDQDADFDGYIAQLRAVIPDDAVVMGQPAFWFGFTEQPYVASQNFIWAESFADEMRRTGVEYVIADEYLTDIQLHHLKELPADEVEDFLAGHGEVVAEIQDPFYGRLQSGGEAPFVTRVYRIRPGAAIE